MPACRICLAVDRKVYPLTEKNLYTCYRNLTGYSILSGDRMPQHICWECTRLVTKSDSIRDKALRSHALLIQILQNSSYISTENILSIDRRANNLQSNLRIKNISTCTDTINVYENINNFNANKITDANKDNEILMNIQEVNVELKNEVDSKNNDTEDFSVNFNFNSDVSNASSDVALVRCKSQKKVEKSRITDNQSGIKGVKIDRRRKPANEVLNEALFHIVDLSFEEQKEEIRKRKESPNYKNGIFKCDSCFKGFLDEEVYNGHRERHTDRCGVYECEICMIRFKKLHSLRNHVTSHTHKFFCKCCPYVTTRRHAAKLHEEWHNGTKYQCPHCQDNFVKFSTYMGHIRIKHPSDFVCELCGYSFVSEKGLRLHKKLKHRFSDEQALVDGPLCEKCEVRFVSEQAYERHLKLSAKHIGDRCLNSSKSQRRPYGTTVKSGQTNSKDGTQKRNKRNNNCKPEGPIQCEQCDMQLPDSLSYYRHFRRIHPDKNRTNYPSMKSKSMCEVCGKMFQSLALLQDHSFTHTNSKQFQCTECDKSFQRKYRLIAHARVHRATRVKHACTLCGKHFTTASNRQRHMFSHTGLKPFKCEMCGKAFKHASEKRAHVTYVHMKKPWPKRPRAKRRQERLGQVSPSVPMGESETNVVQSLWPPCSVVQGGRKTTLS